jgi:hypothetical protein
MVATARSAAVPSGVGAGVGVADAECVAVAAGFAGGADAHETHTIAVDATTAAIRLVRRAGLIPTA